MKIVFKNKVNFITRDGPNFHEIFKNICGHKSETMECMDLKICMSDKHHRYYKHSKFRQNPRGDPKFLVDLTWNDPYGSLHGKFEYQQ